MFSKTLIALTLLARCFSAPLFTEDQERLLLSSVDIPCEHIELKSTHSVDFNSDGNMLAYATHDGASVINLQTDQRLVKHFSNVNFVKFIPGSQTLAITLNKRIDDTVLWDTVHNETTLVDFYQQYPWVKIFPPDDLWIRIFPSDNSLELWNNNFENSVGSGKLGNEFALPDAFNSSVTIQFYTDDTCLVHRNYVNTVTEAEKTRFLISLSETRQGKCKGEPADLIRKSGTRALSNNPNGMIARSYVGLIDLFDKQINHNDTKPIATITDDNIENAINTLSFSPDGSLLAYGSDDGLRLCSLKSLVNLRDKFLSNGLTEKKVCH